MYTQKPATNTQKINRKEPKHNTIKKTINLQGKRLREERNRELQNQPENNEQNGRKYITYQ